MSEFSAQLINWQKVHGRHDLPWQNTTDPFAIWVSEIMLQQTQVTAVIGYYAKFMTRFPDIATLAQASEQDVLQYWSGLGYYSRARNLRKAAIMIMENHHGVFPQNFETIQTLPGIGRSTAAAIASFSFGQIQTILDGNVKRVLTRHYLVEGWPGTPKVEKSLWSLATSLLPANNMVAYTQGLMDLGATVCTRSKPKCYICPLKNTCKAYEEERVSELPTPKPRKATPQKHTGMLVLMRGDQVLLETRPSSGIWGGLLSLPEIENTDDMSKVLSEINARFDIHARYDAPLPKIQHIFTHFKLAISPLMFHVGNNTTPNNCTWLSIEQAINAAIPTPIRTILKSIKKTSPP